MTSTSVRLLSVGVMTILSLCACENYPASTFDVSATSRLPYWFRYPAGTPRADFDVVIDYYARPEPGSVRITLKNRHSGRRVIVFGSIVASNEDCARLNTGVRPCFVLIDSNHVADMIEHRSFDHRVYMSDDARMTQRLRTQSAATTRDR